MEFNIKQCREEDVFKDIIRVNESYRRGIKAGSICKIQYKERNCFAIIRGTTNVGRPTIEIDEQLRDLLELKVGANVELQINKANWIGELKWAWRASDPAYRVALRLALVSFFLGLVGLTLGIVSLLLSRGRILCVIVGVLHDSTCNGNQQ